MAYADDRLGRWRQIRDLINSGDADISHYPDSVYGCIQCVRDLIADGADVSHYDVDVRGMLLCIRDLLNTDSVDVSHYTSDQYGILQCIRDLVNISSDSISKYSSSMDNCLQAIIDFVTASGWPQSGKIVLSANSVVENSVNGATVGTASISGSYTGTPSWSITDATGTFEIDASTGEVTVLDNTDLDHSLHQTIAITVSVSGTTPAVSDLNTSITVTASSDNYLEYVPFLIAA